jgi:hypothetical protein
MVDIFLASHVITCTLFDVFDWWPGEPANLLVVTNGLFCSRTPTEPFLTYKENARKCLIV